MYERQSRLSDRKQERLIKYFVASKTIREAAELVGVHRNTAASFYTRLRKVIAEETEKEMVSSLPVGGEIEAQVVSFKTICRGKQGSGVSVDVKCLVLSKRGESVCAMANPITRTATLMSIMERLILPGSIVYTEDSPKYYALDGSVFTHVRQYSDLYGIQNFCDQANFFFERFHGIPNQSFHLFLKEYEWRFNGGDDRELLEELETWVRLRQNRT